MQIKNILILSAILFLLYVECGFGQTKQSYIIKLNSENGNDLLLNSAIQKPLYHQLLSNYKNKKNTQLSSKKRALIESLLSYRTADLSIEQINNVNKKSYQLIEPNYTYTITQESTKPNDPRYDEQWALEYLDSESAWQKASGKGIVVGVIDTGLDWEHEDLTNQIWINPAEDINSNGKFDPWSSDEVRDGIYGDINSIDEDKNGMVDDIIGYDFVNQKIANIGDWNTFDPIPMDENGHGTLVSGVIAAERDNKKGIAGLAYSSRIMVLRCFDITGHGNADNVATAIIYGVLNGVKVFNLSFGEKYNSSLMLDAIDFAVESGCVVVASSGNEGSDDPHYPSDYEGVISVGYSNKQSKRDNFSNYGSRLDLLAPGSYIMTTSFSGEYRTSSGSSLAAPFVSALSAMMFEINPELSPTEMSTIINLSADDYGTKGWDQFYGAGILNINKALNYANLSDIHISVPRNESTFNKSEISSISFHGSIIVPLIENYELYIGEGYNPDEWTELHTSKNQVLNDTLFNLDISTLKDSSYTFRIKVNLRNNQSIEKSVRFNIISNDSKLYIVNTRIVPSYFNEKRVVVLAVETNTESIVTVRVTQPTDTIGAGFTDNLTKTKYHVILIDDYIQSGTQYDCIIAVTSDVLNESTIEKSINISIKDDVFSTDKYIQKKYSTDLSYIYNKVTDFNNDGKPEYASNNISYGIWNATEIYQFENDAMLKRDSLFDIRIPVGFGDSNGDGLNEMLTRNVGSTVLYQPSKTDASVFSSILFADTTSGNFFAGEMYDFTDDGREELVAYSDTSVYILTFTEGIYSIIATAMLDGDLKRIGTSPGLVCGDFDGDNRHELAFGNERGNIFIFEFNNNQLSLEYSNTVDYSYSPQYITTADIDGNGVQEIAIANFGTFPLFGRSVSAEPIWSLKILKSNSANNYDYIFGEYFYGVKQGSTPSGVFFRNGISAGDIGTGNDAVMVSPFPNFYAFTWNGTSRKMEPFWYYPNSFANSAIVYDFDNNGVNEFGFSTGRATEFFEYSANQSSPNSPTEFEGWSVSSNEVYLQWKKVIKDNNEDAVKYYLFYGEEKEGFINILGSTETIGTNLIFDKLDTDNYYWFGISSVSSAGITSDTILTNIYHHSPLEIESAKQINQRRIKLTFTGIVPEFIPEPGIIFISSPTKEFAVAVNRYDDSSFIATWSNLIATGATELTVLSFRDYYNSPSLSDTYVLNITEDIRNPEELYLLNIQVNSPHELELTYSEPVNIIDATEFGNYTLTPSGKISSLSQISNPSTILIELEKYSPIGALGKDYTVTVNNVRALSGKKMTDGAGNSLTFTFFANSLENAFVYPNPVRLSDNSPIYFANLTYQSDIFIYTLNGIQIRKLSETDGNGGVEWDGRDELGNFLESGVYLFNVTGTDEAGNSIESGLKKFAVVR